MISDYSGRKPELRPQVNQAGLANIASTLLELAGFEPPRDFEPSLVRWAECPARQLDQT